MKFHHVHPKWQALLICLMQASSLVYADAANPNDDPAPSKPITKANKDGKLAEHIAPAKYNPLSIDGAIAIKQTEPVEVDLPGVMKIEGASKTALDFTRARKIQLTNGGSKTIYLSDSDPNRIQLPFINPKIIATEALKIDRRDTSNNVYVTFEGEANNPVQVFFESPDGSAVLGLQVVPKSIPSQTIIVEDVASEISADLRKANKSNEYITATQSLMEVVALGGTPSGYSVVEMSIPPIGMNGLVIEVIKKYSNREGDIYVYDAMNPGPGVATLSEAEFDGELVQAVSIFPKPLLKPSEKARVFVLAKKEKSPQSSIKNQ